MTTSKTPVKLACIAAFLLAGLVVVSAFTTAIVVLPFAVIPLIAGIGILRGRAWSSYGLALVELASLLQMPYVLHRAGVAGTGSSEIVVSAAFSGILMVLFFLAGRSLAASGSPRGHAWPWIALSVLGALPSFLTQAFVMPTGSMEDTLLVGDKILVQRFPRLNPRFGDMIVFPYPVDRHQTYVKRIIGLPRDRIRISNKIVYRNGAPLQEPYVVHKTDYVDSYRDNFPSTPNVTLEATALEMLRNNTARDEVIVPAGNYFVLGDNRDQSWDSRYWGFVAADDVLGKPILIYESEERPVQGQTGSKSIWLSGFRWNRFFKVL